MSFDLKDYEDAQSRVIRFKATYPNGRIISNVVKHDFRDGYVLVSAEIYKDAADSLPAAIDWAEGIRETYVRNMQKFYVEDTVTSAISRALALVLETKAKPTRENMERVDRYDYAGRAKLLQSAPQTDQWIPTTNNPDDVWKISEAPQSMEEATANLKEVFGTAIHEKPRCEHGERKWLQGEKNGKPYAGYMCPTPPNAQNKCKPIWLVMSKSTGQWVLPAAPQKEELE